MQRGVLPGDRRAGLDLRPADLGIVATAVAALGHEIVDPALAVLVAGEPVLDRRVLDLGVLHGDQFDHGRVQLVLVARGCSAAFEIAHIRAFVGDQQRALELAGLGLVDAEIGRKLHRAANALGDVAERAVGEDRRVQRRIEVVRHRHDRAEVLLDQIGVLADRFRDRAEDDAHLVELGAERRRDRHRVDHRVHGDARLRLDASQQLALLQRHAQLLVHFEQRRIDLIERLRPVGALGRRVIVHVLEVDLGVVHLRPDRLCPW